MTHATAHPTEIRAMHIYAKLVLVAAMWGGTFVAGRTLVSEVEPIFAALARFGLASVFLVGLTWSLEDGLPRLRPSQLLLTMGLGATGVAFYNVFFFAALSHMSASQTAVFVAFNPMSVAVLMAAFGRERLTRSRAAGFCIALVGAVVVIRGGDMHAPQDSPASSLGVGELLMSAAVLSWVGYTLLGRRTVSDLSPLATTTYAALWGTVFLFFLALLDGTWSTSFAISWEGASALIYLAIFGTVLPFVWYCQGLQTIGASRTAVFTNLVPLFGVIFGVLVLQEPMTLGLCIGGLLVALGVVLTNTPQN
ncbi:MAG: DMT family transporter [Marinovum sp.]|nr:DMT family transporter [Marinovum sp.]